MHGLPEMQMAFVSAHLNQTLAALNAQELVDIGVHFQAYILASGNRHQSGLQMAARPYRGAERAIVQRGFIYIHNERIWPVVCRSVIILTAMAALRLLRRRRGHICVIVPTLVTLEYMKHLFSNFFQNFSYYAILYEGFSHKVTLFFQEFFTQITDKNLDL